MLISSLKLESFIKIIRITDVNPDYNTDTICVQKETEECWILLPPQFIGLDAHIVVSVVLIVELLFGDASFSNCKYFA